MKFLKHRKGATNYLYGVIIVVVVIIVAVSLIPVAIDAINDSIGNYTGASRALVLLIPTLLVVGLLILAVAWAVGHRKK